MSWFSNLVGVFSPRRAAEMEAWQAQRELIKRWGYDAGGYDKENRHWLAPMESSETTASHDRDTVRARARDLERNSDIAKSVVHAFKRNVVGSGFKLQARTAKTKFNADIELAWRRWTKARNCDVTGQQSFNQLLRMAVERKKVDGGILFKKCYTPGGLVPFKLQALEVDELDTSQYTPKNPANKIINGIEYDAYNKPVGYWIRRYSLDGYQIIEPEYVEAKDIIFYFQKSRPSQVREMSDMAPTLTRIRDVNEFVKAISIKERIAACLSAFITKTSSTPTGGMGRGLGAPPAAPKHSYEGKRITPGMIMELNEGENVTSVNPPGSGSESAAYLKIQQGLIASGQGISYEALTRDMSQTNYSSARQSLIEDQLIFDEEIELLTEKIMDEVYETFVMSAVLSGVVSAPAAFWNKLDDYLQHEWVASPKSWIDPSKEANANMVALKTGQKTFKAICAENGRDYEDVLDEIAQTKAYAEKLGLNLGEGGVLFGIAKEAKAESPEPAEPPEDGEPVPGSED